ncbi:conserved hypothetical protein [Pseudomonas protegens Pf-5]|uniref:Uncharacterized protein n=1 Tax=Pseudomonas fluorescens (strain ATCC BAA-477 / NRRL B-23932 / Pf-5) TaxID=220664 RepID=Q4KKC7_PSEF5|nr:conserved hypothetical protein [Pseudomonas protegens Pf-5]
MQRAFQPIKACDGHGDSNNEKPLCSGLLVRALRPGAAVCHLLLRHHAGPSDRQGPGVPRQRQRVDRGDGHRCGGLGLLSGPENQEKTARTEQDPGGHLGHQGGLAPGRNRIRPLLLGQLLATGADLRRSHGRTHRHPAGKEPGGPEEAVHAAGQASRGRSPLAEQCPGAVGCRHRHGAGALPAGFLRPTGRIPGQQRGDRPGFRGPGVHLERSAQELRSSARCLGNRILLKAPSPGPVTAAAAGLRQPLPWPSPRAPRFFTFKDWARPSRQW